MSRDYEIAQSHLPRKFILQFTTRSNNKQHETAETQPSLVLIYGEEWAFLSLLPDISFAISFG